MSRNEGLITQALKYENLTLTEIVNVTALSQSIVCRTMENMPILKLHEGRSTKFALIEDIDSFGLFQVDSSGVISQIGDLYLQQDGRTVLLQGENHRCYEGLPFYFYDALPTGFLGKIYLKKIIQKDDFLTENSQYWSSTQILQYLINFGEDLASNLLLDKHMARQASKKQYLVTSRDEYSQVVNSLDTMPKNLGSPIAGNRPKFTIFNGQNHLIVKYTPLILDASPMDIRECDLIICEHLALEALRLSGITASESTLHYDDRIYLELKRFDCVKRNGRKGIISLRSVDAEYVGLNSSWLEIAKALLEKEMILQDDFFVIETAYAFGRYIANTDMHNGNISFFMEDLELNGVTPVYDMLPMAFMPTQSGMKISNYTIPRFIDVSNEARERALCTALHFWNSVNMHPLISQEFKSIAKPLFDELLEQRDIN